ncbi:MAG: hypothetical protein IIZ25_04960 [Thermoguttaceae bacterium]|nr:hypothetical protein [Thermoguttaceae bacterium]
MIRFFLTGLILLASLQLQAADWPPRLEQSAPFNGRAADRYIHGSQSQWGAENPEQTDEFVVLHPQDDCGDNAVGKRPLYVVLHSAGHALDSALECTLTPGNHDIYTTPDGFYGLYVDCRANEATDWWWGGPRPDEETDENRAKAGFDLSPCEKRVIDTVRWVIETYPIDTNRVYLSGNSMGGSGTLGIGLRHGDVFAAIKANVPAGCAHAAARLGFDAEIPAGETIPDPPILVDYSANNDHWSFDHAILFRGMRQRHYALMAFWGPFGHQNNHAKIDEVNDLIHRFDWTGVRRDEAYPVFTDATTDDPVPWTDDFENLPEDAPAGQVNGFFRWEVVTDTPECFEIRLRLASAEEIASKIFEVPTTSTAAVSLRRLQAFRVAPGEEVTWTFGDQTQTVQADADGLVTIPDLTITDTPVSLKLTRSVRK